MSSVIVNNSHVAKLIVCQPLAASDSAAIFAFEVITFDKRTGVLVKRDTYYPSLVEQHDHERTVDVAYLQVVLFQMTTQNYLTNQVARAFNSPKLSDCMDAIESNIWNDQTDCVFWWHPWKAYPILRSFYIQFSNHNIDTWDHKKPIRDVQTFLDGEWNRDLETTEDLFGLINELSGKLMEQQQMESVQQPAAKLVRIGT